jgi:hypothetical protein
MKTLNYLFAALLLLLISAMTQAQDAKALLRDWPKIAVAIFKADGICGQCKQRILNAVKAKGIKSAYWDEESKMLTVQYDEKLTSPDAIQSLIAAAGHDTEKIKAEDKVYNALPKCCHYRTV